VFVCVFPFVKRCCSFPLSILCWLPGLLVAWENQETFQSAYRSVAILVSFHLRSPPNPGSATPILMPGRFGMLGGVGCSGVAGTGAGATLFSAETTEPEHQCNADKTPKTQYPHQLRCPVDDAVASNEQTGHLWWQPTTRSQNPPRSDPLPEFSQLPHWVVCYLACWSQESWSTPPDMPDNNYQGAVTWGAPTSPHLCLPFLFLSFVLFRN
jgi:hypothetical protein